MSAHYIPVERRLIWGGFLMWGCDIFKKEVQQNPEKHEELRKKGRVQFLADVGLISAADVDVTS
jgi:hypothetical protein